MRSQAIRGKYVAMQMPRKKKEEQPQQVPQIPQQNFFAAHICFFESLEIFHGFINSFS